MVTEMSDVDMLRRIDELERWLYSHLRDKNCHRAPTFPPYDMPPQPGPSLVERVCDVLNDASDASPGDNLAEYAATIIEMVHREKGVR